MDLSTELPDCFYFEATLVKQSCLYVTYPPALPWSFLVSFEIFATPPFLLSRTTTFKPLSKQGSLFLSGAGLTFY